MTKPTISKQALKDAIKRSGYINHIPIGKVIGIIDQFEDVKMPSDETIDKEEILSNSEKFFGAMLLTRQFNESQIHNIKRYAILLREEYASQSSSDVRKGLEEATAILKDVMMFINESQGIFGWHENGDNAYWEEFDFVKDIASFLSNRQVKA